MKLNEKQLKRSQSAAELKAELVSTTEKYFRLTFKHRVTPLPNALELRHLRRHIARLNTWIEQKQQEAAS